MNYLYIYTIDSYNDYDNNLIPLKLTKYDYIAIFYIGLFMSLCLVTICNLSNKDKIKYIIVDSDDNKEQIV